MEHHSNIVPWQYVTKKTKSKLKYMYINDNFEISQKEIEEKITDKTKIVGITHVSNVLGTINPVKDIIKYAHKKGAIVILDEKEIEEKITDKTKIVGITHVSNVLGTINPVKDIIKYAHKKGAIVILDASQSIPHFKIDVQDLDADFVVFSGHKMLAPLGIGVLYGKKELLQKMNPFLMGGDMIEYVHEQETTFAPLPNKFEAGTQNVEGVVGLGAAIDYINKIGYENIEKEEKGLTEYARKELEKLDFLDLYLTPNNVSTTWNRCAIWKKRIITKNEPIFNGRRHDRIRS